MIQVPTGKGSTDQRVEQIMQKRSGQLTYLTGIGMVICAIITTFEAMWLTTALLVTTLPGIAACGIIAKRGNAKFSSEMLVWLLTLMLMIVLWSGNGHYGAGLVGVPCVMIFAAMLGTTRSFIAITIVSALNIFLMGYLHNNDILQFGDFAPNANATRHYSLVVMILVSGYAIGIIIKDYANAIAQLADENEKVRQSEKAIAFLANHDRLTELPNRTIAAEHFRSALARNKGNETNCKIALLFIDLDDFKNINDSLGHETGDRYLVAIGERLRNITRETDTVCRLGGDEFMIIAEDIDDIRDVTTLAVTVQERIIAPVVTGQHRLVCSASIGIALYPDDGDQYDELVKKADIAMYQSKDVGRNTFQYYSSAMNSDALERMQLLEDLRSALRHDELFVEYQPINELTSGRVVGVEALARWKHPVRGMVRPDIFIPLAEKSGMIVEIGNWVLETACRDLAKMQAAYSPNFRVAVNVSTVQLKRDDFHQQVKQAIEQYKICPTTLELEITESELISDSPDFDREIAELKTMGVSLAIDDFGTGYSNLGYVQKIKVAKLKIDRVFVHGIEKNSDSQAIVRAVHNIADGLVMHTVAEGVENANELQYLKEIGITHGQGYLWSRPVPLEVLMQLLRDHAA